MTTAVVVCAVAVAWVLWTLVGYPLWLAFRARVRPHPIVEGDITPGVTAVIPVHNGAPFLAAKIDSVLALDYPRELLDILVISDGSTDDTDAIAERYRAEGKIAFLRLPKGGKAAALTEAFTLAKRDVLLLTDVRQQLEPHCLRALVRRLNDPTVGVVSGTLKIRRGETSGEEGTGLYWRYESWIRDNLSAVDSVLGATGPIYAIRRSLVRPLPAGCILDDMWLPYQAILAGKRAVVAHDAIAWDYPTSLDSEFRRKVRTQAGLYQLMKQEPRLLQPWRHRLFLTFINVKLARLLMPYALLMFLFASPFLPWPLNLVAIAAQAAFYGVAVLAKRAGDRGALAKVGGPISTFVTLMVAAFSAQAIFFRDPSSLWKVTQVRLVTNEKR